MATSGNASNWSGYLFSYRGDEAGIQGLSADTRLEDLLVRNMGSCGESADLDFGVRLGTGVAGGTKVMRLPYRRPGSVDIGYFGTGLNGASLDVKGVIRGGRDTATQGGDILVGRASSDSTNSTYPTTLNVFGSQFSSGNSVISYGTRPRSGAVGYESSWSVTNIARAALEVGVTGSGGFAGLALYTVPQNISAVGTAYTSNLTELLSVNTNAMIYAGGTAAFDGRVGIGTRSPQQPFVVSSGGAAGIEIVPSSGIVQAYNRSTSAYSPLVLDASTATIRLGPSNTAVLTAQSGGVTFNGTTDCAGAARFASTLSVTNTTASTSATTGALVVSGGLGVGGAIYSTAGITSSGAIRVTASTASTSTTTGALTVAGGVGVGGTITATGITVDTLRVSTATMSAPSGSAPLFAARAWGRFVGAETSNPTGVVGGNIASITRTALGEYTVVFTSAMPNATYSVIFGGSNNLDGRGLYTTIAGASKTATGFKIRAANISGTVSDINTNNEAFFAVFA
jgi:hypothetical protein